MKLQLPFLRWPVGETWLDAMEFPSPPELKT